MEIETHISISSCTTSSGPRLHTRPTPRPSARTHTLKRAMFSARFARSLSLSCPHPQPHPTHTAPPPRHRRRHVATSPPPAGAGQGLVRLCECRRARRTSGAPTGSGAPTTRKTQRQLLCLPPRSQRDTRPSTGDTRSRQASAVSPSLSHLTVPIRPWQPRLHSRRACLSSAQL
jgi:hypothetical protein